VGITPFACARNTGGMLDIGLTYDPVRRRCDLTFDGRDIVMDTTPLTPMLISVGCARRARADDELPTGSSDPTQPFPVITVKCGSPGDALDARGRLTGSRMWLLSRAKQTEEARRKAEGYLVEALDELERRLGQPVTVLVQWVARGILGYQVQAGNVVQPLQLVVA
jgi:phage gp46-like protein